MTGISTIDVAQSSIGTLSELIAAGAATPNEVLEAYLERINAVEERGQAWSHLDVVGARATAAQLSEEAAAGRLRGPLHGVPVGVKDEFHVAGMPTYFADPSGQPQPADAASVERLREAGAVIVGKTHMPIDGKMPPTCNPWNLAHTAGGTSSGSGAAVAACMVPFALGEQTAGSNLRPAAFCGVAGLKPTFGRISRRGCYQFSWSFDHVGLIGLTMADLALVSSAFAGHDPRDPTSLREPAHPADLDLASLPPPRIGVVRNFFPQRAQLVMQEAVGRAVQRLKGAGAAVLDVSLPEDFGLIWMVHRLALGVEASAFHSRRVAAQPTARLNLRDRVASAMPATYYLHAQRIRQHLWQSMLRLFSEFDALLLPAATGAAPMGTDSTGDAAFLVPWSCLGYPAITLNGGLSDAGLPLGLQFVGAPVADHALLRTCAWCEGALGRLPAPRLD
jgi:aspartyl-tRNA(Asn)/glutamyl-tRNA(Gln) amidotransferase subunit A